MPVGFFHCSHSTLNFEQFLLARDLSPPLMVDFCCLLLGAVLVVWLGFLGSPAPSSISDTSCHWASGMGSFQHPQIPLSRQPSTALYLWGLPGRRGSPAPPLGSRPLLGIGPGSWGSRQPGADGFCLCSSPRSNESLSGYFDRNERVSCSLPRGFYAGPGSRRVCCPSPCSLRLLFPLRGGSWKRAGFQACPPAVAHHLLPVTFCSLVPPMGTFGVLPYPGHSRGPWVEACTELLASECRLLLCLGSPGILD